MQLIPLLKNEVASLGKALILSQVSTLPPVKTEVPKTAASKTQTLREMEI